MAVNDKTEVTVTDYIRSQRPVVADDLTKYIFNELQRIQTSIGSLTNAATQVTDRAPDNPQKGMIRFNVSPWDPLGDSSEGLVVYNGTAWEAV